MRNDRQQALKLRIQGKSYTEIADLLNIPKSTLSGWFHDLHLSGSARKRLESRVNLRSFAGLMEKNRLQTVSAQKRAKEIRFSSAKEITTVTKRDLFLLGVALYWAEGHKRTIVKDGKERTYHPVSLSNSDPKLIKLFLKFLREICDVKEEQIYAELRIYQHHNAGSLLKFWSQQTNIDTSRFAKFYYGVSKSTLHKRPYNILPYGTIQIRVNSTELYHRIMGWIEGLMAIG